MSRFNTKKRFLTALAIAISIGTTAWAGGWNTFDNSAFKKAQESGQTVLVDFHATWCPVCAKQKPALDKLLGEKEFQGVKAFVADYDTSTELKKQMRIASQSTLVLFKGKREVARSTGVTDPSELRALLRKGL
jgi:thioredoxin